MEIGPCGHPRGAPDVALRALEPLALLLEMNRRGAALEREGRAIAGPGLPPFSDDCLRMPG